MENTTGYSLSDIAAVSDGMNGGNSIIWLLILFLFLGNNGFNRGDYGQYATAASQQEILFGQQFQNLDNKLDRLGNGIADATFSVSQQINNVQNGLGNAVANEGRSIQTQLCAINSNIDNKFAALEKSQLEQRIAEQAQQINQLQLAQAMCGVPKISTAAWGVYPYNACGCGGAAY